MTDAIGARRDQVAALDRPERLNAGFSIKDAVDAVRETPDLHKVYVPQWIMTYTSEHPGFAGKLQAEQFFEHQYAERVRPEDVRYAASSDALPERFPWRLLLRLPTVVGEFKTKALAEEFVRERGYTDAVIVARNSREEFKLRDYSKKKLPRSERG